MALKSVYLPFPVIENDLIRITEEEHRHLAVARVQQGEAVEVFNGTGRLWMCEVTEIGKRQTTVRVQREEECPPPKVELLLGQALIRGAAFEFALEKAVEIGVTRIIPVVASRSNVSGERRDRWQRILVEAAKQSKRFHLPKLESPLKFSEILNIAAPSRIVFAEHDGSPLKSALAGSPVLFLIGPEGGWIDEELDAAAHKGFHRVTLGAGIMRSETAAIVGGSLIRYELGDM
jgi:16S rRNA (uracil1498-N3)-methyltransferase